MVKQKKVKNKQPIDYNFWLVVFTSVIALFTIINSLDTKRLINSQIELTDAQIEYIDYQTSSDVFFNVYNNKVSPYAIEGNDLFLGYEQFKENPEIIINVVNSGSKPLVFSVIGFGSCRGPNFERKNNNNPNFWFMTTNRKEIVESGRSFTQEQLLNVSIWVTSSLPCELIFQLISDRIVLEDKIIIQEKILPNGTN